MTSEDSEDFSDIMGEGIDASWGDLKKARGMSKGDERRYRRLDG